MKYVSYIVFLSLVLCITGCGSSSSSSPVTIYALPSTSTANSLMGGSVQPGAIATTPDFSNSPVTTISGTPGFAGFLNYSTALPPALFNHPNDITYDGTYFYVADYGNNAIRKINPSSGKVTTLTCTDSDTSTAVGFNQPSGITTDGKNIYVADSGSNTIRAIDVTTNISTRIGSATGVAGSVDSADRNAVLFNRPVGITTDGVNLYVTDYNNATVRWIDLQVNKYAVYTLAGVPKAPGSSNGVMGNAHFNLPGRITTDGTSLYLTDFFNRTIRQIDIKSATVTTLAGSPGQVGADDGSADGTGAAARFNQPNGITTDGKNLYITDSYLNTIRMLRLSDNLVTTISGVFSTSGAGGYVDSSVGTPKYYTPIGITTDGTSLFVADSQNNIIRKIH